MYLHRMYTHTCILYVRVTKPFTSTIKKAQSFKKKQTKIQVYLTEVHLETENGNDTATAQKQLFVLYWHRQNIYML